MLNKIKSAALLMIFLVGCQQNGRTDTPSGVPPQPPKGEVLEDNCKPKFSNTQLGSITVVYCNKDTILYQVTGFKNPADPIFTRRSFEHLAEAAIKPEAPIAVTHLKTLGKGGQTSVYQYGNDVLRILPTRHLKEELKALETMLKLQNLEGIAKIRRILKTDDGQTAVVLETLTRKDLTIGAISANDFAVIATSLARTLQEIHKRGFKHEDISHNNIMFRGTKPVLIDFGSVGSTFGKDDASALATSLRILRMNKFYENRIFNTVRESFTATGSDADFFEDFYLDRIIRTFGLGADFIEINLRKCLNDGAETCENWIVDQTDHYLLYRALTQIAPEFNEASSKSPEFLVEFCKENKSKFWPYFKCDNPINLRELSLLYAFVKILKTSSADHRQAWKNHQISLLKPTEKAIYSLASTEDLGGFITALAPYSGTID